jgi:hypothetical protein
MATRMQQRRGTASQWTSADPILEAGEFGFESDTGKFKIGDGVNQWSDLDYFINEAAIAVDVSGAISDSEKGAANGVATLDSGGKVPLGQLGNLIDGAPNALNTLNEIAAALNDDENFGSATVAHLDQLDGLIDAHSTSLGNISTSLTSINGSISTLNTTTNGLTSDVGSLQSDLGSLQSDVSSVTSDLATHASDTTNIHGITNTADLATKTYADTAASTAAGTVTKSSLGLGNVNNTADTDKPVSTATQTALNLKANLAGPTFTGTVSGITKSMVGLGNVDNTADADKPVSTATQTALDAKLSKSGGTMTGALTLSGAPTSDLHAATKQYVDGIAAGINFHQPVVAATTGNLAGVYDNGTNGYGATLTASANASIGTIDGATVSVGSRILLRAQTDAKQNGIYTVTNLGSGSAKWVVTRAADADNNPSGELANGDFCFVTGGSTNTSKGFILSTTGTITIGTTEITYSQFNASEAVVAGDGITKSGATLSIGTGAITSAMILNGTIATEDIANGAITTDKIANGAVVEADLADGAVTSAKIANGTIVDADINASAAIAQSKVSGLTTDLAGKADKTATINDMNGSHTIIAGDVNNIREMSGGGTIAIPSDNSFWPIGQRMEVVQTGGSQVTIAGSSGVTVNGTPGLKLRAQWSAATIIKRAANTFVVIGDLSA